MNKCVSVVGPTLEQVEAVTNPAAVNSSVLQLKCFSSPVHRPVRQHSYHIDKSEHLNFSEMYYFVSVLALYSWHHTMQTVSRGLLLISRTGQPQVA